VERVANDDGRGKSMRNSRVQRTASTKWPRDADAIVTRWPTRAKCCARQIAKSHPSAHKDLPPRSASNTVETTEKPFHDRFSSRPRRAGSARCQRHRAARETRHMHACHEADARCILEMCGSSSREISTASFARPFRS